MNTNFNLPLPIPPATLPSITAPLEGENLDIKSSVGQLILQLAHNFLPPDMALPFALQKVKIMTEKGISLAGKLHQNQVRHILSELGVLSLSSQIADKQTKPKDENEMALNILDFSNMTDDELKAKEMELENELQRLELKAQINKHVHTFSEILKVIKNNLPFIDPQEMLHHFQQALEQAATQSPDQISVVATEWILNVQTNAARLSQIIEKSRQYISEQANEYGLKSALPFIELQTRALILAQPPFLVEQLHLNISKFESALTQLYANLIQDSHIRDLADQWQNEVNHQLWNQFLEDNYDIQALAKCQYSIKNLDKEEIDEVRTSIDNKMPALTKTWSLSTSAFTERYMQPVVEARNRLLLKIKNRHDNQHLALNFLQEYGNFLLKKAQEVHKVTPPQSLIDLQYADVLRTYFPTSTENEPHDNFKEYVESIKSQIYEKEFEHEWLFKVASYKKVMLLKQNPKEFAEQIWKKEIGDVNTIRQQKLNEWVEQAAKVASSDKVSTEDLQELENSLAAVRPEINRLELADLQQLLAQDQEIHADVAREIMSDWKVIGTRVQLNLTVLDKAAKERVVNIAKNRSQLNLTLGKVKADLEHHVLTPNPVVIESKYRKLKELMGEFPQFNNPKEATQCYNTIVNKALLQQELLKRKSSSYNRGSFRENQLLNWLNFKPNENYQSLAVNQLIEDMLLSAQLSEQNAELLKKEILEAEFKGRLKAAGVADNELENIKKLLQVFEKLRSDMGTHLFSLAQKAVPLDKYDHLPKIKLSLKRTRYNKVISKMSAKLEEIFKKDSLKKALSLDPTTFEKDYLSLIAQTVIDDAITNEAFKVDLAKDLQEKMAFYEKWHHRLAVDAIQGLEDSNEVLTHGVCAAKCLRVGSYEKAHPDELVNQIGGERISPIDRYEQARYKKAFHDVINLKQGQKVEDALEQVMTVPKEVLKRYGYKHVTWLAAILEKQMDSTQKKFADEVMMQLNDLVLTPEIVQQLEQTNGVMFLILDGKDWGHALHFRLDFKRGIFRLHDPNIGIFEIPVQKGNIQAAKELTLLCKEIFETLYSDTLGCQLFQLT